MLSAVFVSFITLLGNGAFYCALMFGSGLSPFATFLWVVFSPIMAGRITRRTRRRQAVMALLVSAGSVAVTLLGFGLESQCYFWLAKREAGQMAIRIREYQLKSGSWPDAIRTVDPSPPWWLYGFFLHYEVAIDGAVLEVGRREWKARWNWDASRWEEPEISPAESRAVEGPPANSTLQLPGLHLPSTTW